MSEMPWLSQDSGDDEPTRVTKLYGGSEFEQALEQLRELHARGALLYADVRYDKGVTRIRIDALETAWKRVAKDFPGVIGVEVKVEE